MLSLVYDLVEGNSVGTAITAINFVGLIQLLCTSWRSFTATSWEVYDTWLYGGGEFTKQQKYTHGTGKGKSLAMVRVAAAGATITGIATCTSGKKVYIKSIIAHAAGGGVSARQRDRFTLLKQE